MPHLGPRLKFLLQASPHQAAKNKHTGTPPGAPVVRWSREIFFCRALRVLRVPQRGVGHDIGALQPLDMPVGVADV